MSDRTAHVCVQCGGQFVIALEEAGEAHVDFVYLAPGPWGRLNGLPVLAEGAQWLQAMGTTLFRAGGSFACSADMFWKNWRGKPHTRPSIAVSWGHDLMAGWGPFEVVDMCNAMGIEAVVTTFAVGDKPNGGGPVTPDDMADLVEYSFGNISTEWGRLRIEEDGHPSPYNWSYVELGNV
jgi:alpha-L-arabinofuranosidase